MRQHDVSKFSLSMKGPAAARIVATHDLATRMRPLPPAEAHQPKPWPTLVMAPPGAGKTFCRTERKGAEASLDRPEDFEEGIRQALRRRPSAVLKGEVRDPTVAKDLHAKPGIGFQVIFASSDLTSLVNMKGDEAEAVVANCNVRVFPSQKDMAAPIHPSDPSP